MDVNDGYCWPIDYLGPNMTLEQPPAYREAVAPLHHGDLTQEKTSNEECSNQLGLYSTDRAPMPLPKF